jgi:hypothetical protein
MYPGYIASAHLRPLWENRPKRNGENDDSTAVDSKGLCDRRLIVGQPRFRSHLHSHSIAVDNMIWPAWKAGLLSNIFTPPIQGTTAEMCLSRRAISIQDTDT